MTGRTRGRVRGGGRGTRQSSWLAAVLLGIAPTASAQVNVERLRGGEDVEDTSGSVGFDLSVRTGNVELIQGGAQFRLDQVGRTGTFFVVGNAAAGWKEGGNRFLSDGLLHVRQVFRPGAAVRPEAFAQVNYNEPRGLTLRAVAGGGFRLRMVHSATGQLAWGTSYMFEHERLSLPDSAAHPPRTSVHRWSNYVSARLALTPQATLITTVYAQPRFDFEDVRVLGDASLGAAMSETVSLVVTLHAYHDSHPPDGKRALDTILRTGIAVGF